MTLRPTFFSWLLLLFLGAAVSFAPSPVLGEDDDDDDDISRVELIGGLPTVTLSEETQEQTGIEVVEARNVTYREEITAFGRVMDLGPLFALRERVGAAAARLGAGEAALTYGAKNLKRLKKLKGDVSTKALQQAEMEKRASRAEVNGALLSLRALRGAARTSWGKTLADMALADGDAAFKPFLLGEAVVLLVTLPPGESLPQGVQSAQVGDADGGAVQADYLSAAPMADPVIGGDTYFFSVPGLSLRSGRGLLVRLAGADREKEGVIVPHEAIIWYSGKPWAYVQVDETHFVRRHVPEIVETDEGWFTMDAVRAGEKLVRQGAQMLLSEEFRWQINEEDDD